MNTTQTLIVYVDDAQCASQALKPMVEEGLAAHWVLVACAPRMTRRIGKWLSHTARENWRDKWCDKLFAQVRPLLATAHSQVECVVATGSLVDLTNEIRVRFPTARVLDARKPKFVHEFDSNSDAAPRQGSGWQMPAALSSLGAFLVLAAE